MGEEKFKEVYLGAEDYDSEFEAHPHDARKRKNTDDLFKEPKKHQPKARKEVFVEECDKEQRQVQRLHFLSKDAYTRHKELINQYVLCYRGATSKLTRDRSKDKTDYDVIKANHQFLWDEEKDSPDTWEKQLAKKYYDKLFKEYCLADLSRYKENKIAMRWRTEVEVIEGKGTQNILISFLTDVTKHPNFISGQFSCGHIRCSNKEELRSWEVNFGYMEQNVKKNALIKIRLCPKCSYKLNYHHKRKEITKSKLPTISDAYSSTKSTDDADLLVDGSSASIDGLDPSSSQPSETKESSDSESDIWKKPVCEEEIETTKSRDDDFEKYLTDMLL